MRIDKYLKNARIIKRRQIAKEACEGGRVSVNGKNAKPGTEVAVGDVVEIRFGQDTMRFEITEVLEHVRKEQADDMYRML